jgi:hypothetical protein
MLRRRTDGDRERHRERKGDDADDDSRENVGPEITESVAFSKGAPQGIRQWKVFRYSRLSAPLVVHGNALQ